jgi:hypothetical protein
MIHLPRFYGLEKNRSEADRAQFVRTVAGAGYDPVGVAAVIELESAQSWNPAIRGPKAFSMPPGYPIGLIQFSPDTAQSMGTSTAELEQMSFAEQLRYVTAYYAKFGGPSAFHDPGDYYLAGWGTSPSSDDDKVLARDGSAAYTANKGLDTDGDGVILAGELRGLIHRKISDATTRGTWRFDMDLTTSITIRVQNPQGEQIGITSISDADAPGMSILAATFGAPVMIAYPNGWRFLQFAPGVQIPAKTGHPFTAVEQQSAISFGWQSGAAIGIIGIAVTILVATLQIQPGRRAHA